MTRRRVVRRGTRTPRARVGLVAALTVALLVGCATTEGAAPAPTTRDLTLATAPTDTRASTTTTAVRPPDPPTSVRVERDVRYDATGTLDVYRGTPASGGALPIVVLFGGRTSDKALYAAVAGRLAAAGAVVYVPAYRAREPQPAALFDARCALWTAAQRATTDGGDPGAITLVGYAFGAVAAVGEAFDGPWKQTAPEAANCPAPPTAVRVRAVVGVVGQYDAYGEPDRPAADFGTYSPYSQLAGSSAVAVHLLQGDVDALSVAPAVAEHFRDAVAASGHAVQYRKLDVPNLALADLTIDTHQTIGFLDPSADHRGVDAVVGEVMAAARG